MNKQCKKNDISFNMTGVFGDAYASKIRAFVECIVEDRLLPVTAANACAATAIAIAATRSMDEGRTLMIDEAGAYERGSLIKTLDVFLISD
jgi:predicted dehydrogenase